MKCPDCFSKSFIIESRYIGRSKRRRHQCCNPECEHRFTAYEILDEAATPVAVKDYLKSLVSSKPKPARKDKIEQLLTRQAQTIEQIRVELSRG